ncbi:MAG: phosphate ABC transporter substrate-binding protein [Clostridiales bacterium]|nr:phosphate ABC transporter substrate-binding protein [Clostridiales bacterium]
MKKLALVILALVLLVGTLSACGSSNASGGQTTNNSPAATTPAGSAPTAGGSASQAAPAPAANVSGSISASGSSALYPLVNIAANQFKAANPNVSMTIAAGGSGTGLNNVLAGTVDIGNSDVYAAEKLDAGDAAKLTDHKVCLIGVAVIVNADVAATVKTLTSDQLKAIFNGTTNNWKQVGGPDEQITIVNRPTSSGTRALFTKWALGGQSSVEGDTSLQTDDSNALLTTVGNTKGTIGYLALSYLNVASANIATVQIDGVDPTYENIYNDKYQVWGYEHMYTNGKPNAQTQAFLDYMMTPTMLTQAGTLGYGDPSKLNADAAKSR